MKTSQNGLNFIAREEGEVDHVYKDIAGIPTIGIGHVVRPGESFPNGITHDQALQILAGDVSTAEGAVNKDITYSGLTQNMFDALVSFTFNCGTGSLAGSSMRTKLNAGDVAGAADAMLLWCHAVINGKLTQDKGLYNRRVRERQLFLTPDGQPLVHPAPIDPPPPPAPPTHPDPSSSNVPVNQQPLLANESPADRIVRLVKSHVGCNLSTRRDELGKLVARGVDDPNAVVTVSTNCATSALGIMAEAGVRDPILNKKYVSGMAVSWVRQIGINTGALVKFDGKTMPKRGALMRYNTPGTNNDHVEWCLSDVDANGIADHGGGGRANNAITEGTGNVLTSLGRPMQEWWDPDKLGIPVLVQDQPAPTPPPPPPVQPGPMPTPLPAPVTPVPVHGPAKSGFQSFIDAITWLVKMLLKPRT